MTNTRKDYLIHKAGRGWYRPNAHGYTMNPAEAGRFSQRDAIYLTHPNGPDGPRDGLTFKHAGEAWGGWGKQTATETQTRLLAIPRRVTPAMVDAEIAAEDYHTFPGSRHTVCALTLRNGFTVTGVSACTDPASFDADLGRDLAKGKAREKVFELLAFRIRDELHLERLRAALKNLTPAKAEADALARAVAALNS